MSDVFISYSRLDKAFVGDLREALAAKDQDVWVDWEDIPPSQSWWDEIQKGIAKANNFVLVLSPSSMGSVVCHMEIEYARQLKKRIIPVLHLPYERDACITSINARLAKPEEFTTRDIWGKRQAQALYDANDGELKHINFFFFRAEDPFAEKFEALFEIIHTDYAYKEAHTTFALRASEWHKRNHDVSFLLLETELDQAKQWLGSSEGKQPAPTDLQRAFIQASEKRNRQLRNIRRTSVIGSLVAVLAIGTTIVAAVVGTSAVNNSLAQLSTATVERGIAEQSAQSANTQVAIAGTAQSNAEQGAFIANTKIAVAGTAQSNAEQGAFIANTKIAVAGTAQSNAEQGAFIASTQAANAQGTATQIPATLTQVNALAQTAREQANTANLEATNASQALATATQALIAVNTQVAVVELTVTQAVIAQDIVTILSETIASNDPYLQIYNMDELVKRYPDQAQAYLARGIIHGIQKAYDLAIDDFTTAISLDPYLADAYFRRGKIFLETFDYTRAFNDFDIVVSLNPLSKDALYYRGVSQNKLGNYALAIEDFTQVLQVDDKYLDAYLERGLALSASGDYENAIPDFTKLIDLYGDVSSYYQRALAYSSLADATPNTATALAYLQLFVSDMRNAESGGYEIPAEWMSYLQQIEDYLATSPTPKP